MPDFELIIQYISDFFFVDFLLKIDSEQKSINVNFHINAQFRGYKLEQLSIKRAFGESFSNL